jgi:hypothetical protein
LVAAALVAGASMLAAQQAAGNDVAGWNATAGRAALTTGISPGLNPLHESRMYAMVHLAIHDALNAIERRSRPYAFDERVAAGASPAAAIAAAARDVLVAVLGTLPADPAGVQAAIAAVEAEYAVALAAIPPGDSRAAGIAAGSAAAAAILARRAADGSDTPLVDPAYVEGTAPGEYRFTELFPFAFAPGWGDVTPFALNHGAQFRARPPDRVTSAAYAADFNEVKRLGGDGVTTASARSPEETQIGFFWLESSPLAWNRLARSVAEGAALDEWQTARLFGLLNMALADGYIGSWEGKYYYAFWRPETAIREGDADGNPDTAGDPSWTPLQFTYPMPDHDSAHAVEGAAAAQVLARVLGTDAYVFHACSLTLPAGSTCDDPAPVFRTYTSFSQAAEENGLSRILVGIHFRRAVDEGLRHGRRIADHAVNRYLQLVPGRER